MQTVKTAVFEFPYRNNPARIVKARDGSFCAVAGGFAGRVRYSSVERAQKSVEAHALFRGWVA